MQDLDTIRRRNGTTKAEAKRAARPLHADGTPWTDKELRERERELREEGRA
jgi:hypothetical protein